MIVEKRLCINDTFITYISNSYIQRDYSNSQITRTSSQTLGNALIIIRPPTNTILYEYRKTFHKVPIMLYIVRLKVLWKQHKGLLGNDRALIS
jgi:hypothetical protein